MLISPGGYRLRQAKSDRLKFNISTSSLDISLARLEDSGVYKLEEFDQFSVSLELSVQGENTLCFFFCTATLYREC